MTTTDMKKRLEEIKHFLPHWCYEDEMMKLAHGDDKATRSDAISFLLQVIDQQQKALEEVDSTAWYIFKQVLGDGAYDKWEGDGTVTRKEVREWCYERGETIRDLLIENIKKSSLPPHSGADSPASL